MIHRNNSYNVKKSDHNRSIPAQCKYTTKLKLINSNKTYFIYNLNDFISSNNAVMDEINELKRAVSIFIKLNLNLFIFPIAIFLIISSSLPEFLSSSFISSCSFSKISLFISRMKGS